MTLAAHRLVAALLVLAVAVGLTLVDPAHSHAQPRLQVSPTNPVPREFVKISGRFGTAIERPVRLQYWTGSRWAVLSTKTTSASGGFAFRTRAVAPSRVFRVLAPRVTRNGRTYGKLNSYPRAVRTVTARARLAFVPAPIAQAKSGTRDLTPGVVTFRPIRRGRKVVLQRYASGWRTIQTGTQNRRGTFTFNVKAASGPFRAITVAANGAPAKRSATKRVAHLPRRFNDGFTGTSLNRNKWDYRHPGVRNGDGDRLCSQSSSRSVTVRNGRLELQTKRISPQRNIFGFPTNPDYKKTDAQCPDGQYYNGHIGTQGHFGFKHGIMAARIRMQPQRGHHGGFWSQPTTSTTAGAEIDGVEYYGNTFTYKGEKAPLQHSIYKNGETKAKVVKSRNYLLRDGRRWSSDYHVFSVQWTPKRYIFRIDGRETFRTARGVSQTDQYLILSLLSSGWELDHLPKSGTLTPMYIDWVRVWK